MRRFSIMERLLAVACIVIVAAAPAVADQSACRNLEASLASVSRGGDRTKLRRYERAIISQRQQLERAQIRQKSAGCASFLSSVKPHCGNIRATVSKMERNLLSLQRTRNELSGGNAAREKARINAELNASGCRGATARNDSPEQPTGLFSRLFGSRQDEENTASGSRERKPDAPGGEGTRRVSVSRVPSPGGSVSVAPGNYRTVCVRTCDGYFFPIAYSSSPKLFDRDTKACEAMCPGTEVELYHHRVPDEETDQMVSSATGEPYTALPAAFSYREPGFERAKSCQCNPPKNFSIIAGDLPEQAETDEQPVEEAAVLPEPDWRPDPAEDPETRANREGGLTAAAIADLLAPPTTVEEPEIAESNEGDGAERRVRVVGPTFLPDPEAAIDLRAPGRTELR
jgi:hypothetical protein